MSFTKDDAKTTLREHNLRVTGPRVAVLCQLASAGTPLSHSEMLERLGETDWDPATIYRNLVKLREAGVAVVANRAEGIDRYALASTHDDEHHHPHFVCDDCGRVACLPESVTVSMEADSPWAASVAQASVQLRGECPDCRKQRD